MSKTALITIVIGDRHKRISKITHPTMVQYAKRINSDFIVYNYDFYNIKTPDGEEKNILSTNRSFLFNNEISEQAFACYNKMNIVQMLDKYDRLLYLDNDVIIRDDAPNIFDIVPENMVGMFEESQYLFRDDVMAEWSEKFKLDYWSWNYKYYNAGIIIFSKQHKNLLQLSHDPWEESFLEQSMINWNIVYNKLPVFSLPHKFNRMHYVDKYLNEQRYESFFIHYAGSWYYLKEGNSKRAEGLIDLISYDLDVWKNNSPKHIYKRSNLQHYEFWIKDFN